MIDFDHPEYQEIVAVNKEIYEVGMNGYQRTNEFLVRLYPNKKFMADREPKTDPSIELVWLL